MPYRKTLFLLADGARARLVERSNETGDFVTFEEIDGRQRLKGLRAELRGSPPASTFSSGSPDRRATVASKDFTRAAKEDFVAEIAERALDVCERRGFEDIVVAAPARLIGPLREQLSAKAHVIGALERDLTKSPDASLPQWLDRIFPGEAHA